MSKELARISQDAAVSLDLPSLARREPDLAALSALYRELGFNSLLRALGSEAVAASVPASAPVVEADYAQVPSVAEFRDYLKKLPAPLAGGHGRDLGRRDPQQHDVPPDLPL